MKNVKTNFWLGMMVFAMMSCGSNKEQQETESKEVEPNVEEKVRVVSLKGSYSETLAAFGWADHVVGVDVTSTYPEEIAKLPKVGHNRNISAEGILALKPTLIIADPKDIKPETLKQLEATGIRHILIEQEYSISGTKKFISELVRELDVDNDSVSELYQKIDEGINGVTSIDSPPKVLFIYARGAGTLLVAGEDTQMEQMIELAGGENAVSGFAEFKPLTSEALVAADPDIILMFSSGAQSIDGASGVSALPGMSETTAGKQQQFIFMEGQYLAGFGPRVGQAVKELNERFIEIIQAN